ncbi:MAG: helix-turn-helix domain-containing protein [Anaerobutyricum hallii]
MLQKKESISSVASKIGVYYTTVDKWLRNYKAIGLEAFFEKVIPIELLLKKKPLFSITFLEKVLSGISVPGTKFQMHRYSEDGL